VREAVPSGAISTRFQGEDAVSQPRRNLKQKAIHQARVYLVISLYLFVVFSQFVVYKSVILAEHHIDFALHGLALINALALAKIVLFAEELHVADRFRDAPLIYPTLLKSFVFSIVLACFKIAEDTAIGRFHGKSFYESVADLGGGSWQGMATLTVLLFAVLIPFFGFTELRRALGEDRMVGAFFQSRHLLNPPPTGS
jgi:hypothetical protein